MIRLYVEFQAIWSIGGGVRGCNVEWLPRPIGRFPETYVLVLYDMQCLFHLTFRLTFRWNVSPDVRLTFVYLLDVLFDVSFDVSLDCFPRRLLDVSFRLTSL